MQVGKMRVRVNQPGMAVAMRVRLAGRIVRGVVVAVMRVVHVPVLVLHRLMDVLVRVPLGQVQPHARAHEQAGGAELPRHRFREHGQRQHGPDERRGRKIRSGARRAEMA